MSQRFVSLNGLRPALIPADYPDASLKWCYLHLKEQDWESSSFLAQLFSDLLCYSLSWQTGQIHTHRAVINNLNLAAKEKVRGVSLKGGFMSDCISLMAVLGGSGVYLHPPFQPATSQSGLSWEVGMGSSNNSCQEGQYKPLVPWLSLNQAPAHADLWEL